MTLIKNCSKNFGVLLLFFIFSLGSTIISGLGISVFFKYILAQTVFIFLPGFTIFKIFNLKTKNSNLELLLSYSIGYAFSIFLYSILLVLKLQNYTRIFAIFIFFCSILYLIKHKVLFVKSENKSESQSEEIFILLMPFVLYVMGVFTFQLDNNFVGKINVVKPDQDLMYWFRNSVAATRSFPLEDLSISGVNFYYHYFSSFYNAYLHFVSGVELFEICFTYSFINNIFLLFGAIYLFCSEFIQNKKNLFLSIILILFTAGIEKYVVVTYITHLYIKSFGAVEGITLSLFALLFFIKAYKRESAIKNQIISFLFFYAAVGAKAPVACVVLAPMGIACIFMLFKKEQRIQGLLTGFLYLLVFFCVYFIFIRGLNNEPYIAGHTNTLSVSLFDSLKSGYSGIFFKFIESAFHNKTISFVFSFSAYIFLLNPVIFIIFVFSIYGSRKQKMTEIKILLLIGIITGIGLTVFVSQAGHSQMYFYFLVPVFAVVFALHENEDFLLKNKKSIKAIFQLCLTLFCFGCFLYSLYDSGSSGLKHFLKANFFNKNIAEDSHSFTKEEIFALRKLRELTEKDCILITNKILDRRGTRSFVVSSFTERQVYIEGDDYGSVPSSISKDDRKSLVADFFTGNKFAYKKAKEENIRYAVVFKNFPYNENIEYFGSRLFENEKLFIINLNNNEVLR